MFFGFFFKLPDQDWTWVPSVLESEVLTIGPTGKSQALFIKALFAYFCRKVFPMASFKLPVSKESQLQHILHGDPPHTHQKQA